ncbi:MAG TPA: methylamine utilization protein [Aquabacterium sp.]|uniref:methylamine utilization protein n=1 Tax=Aquabacterium sp. TaxID=1872578 RepID=UPI002E2F10B4|nr:methylamine utilization protein [Aquabacterium sp.]HEX5357257.1 methylamine utilization protein [Aquabacterium sp.]
MALSLYGASALAANLSIQVLGDNGQSLAGAAVAVFVKGVKATAGPEVTADMAQKNKAFSPTLRVVQTGTSVNFPNFDTVRHHVYSFSPVKTFEIKLYAGTPAAPVIFDKPGTATLGCNIHDRMLGYIHVVDTPYFGVTDSSGRLTLDLPSGEHRVRVWTPAMGEASAGQEQGLKTGQDVVIRLNKP